jgi:hypothetical protein
MAAEVLEALVKRLAVLLLQPLESLLSLLPAAHPPQRIRAAPARWGSRG